MISLKKYKVKLIITFVILGLLVQIGFLVLLSEKTKKLGKLAATKGYYAILNENFKNYIGDFNGQVEEVKKLNAQRMAQAKTEYEDLLKQQPALVASHTTRTTTTVAPSSSSGSTTSTVTVKRPTSKPSTGSSK